MRHFNQAQQLSVWEITTRARPTLIKQCTGKISLEYTDKKPLKFGWGKQKQSCT